MDKKIFIVLTTVILVLTIILSYKIFNDKETSLEAMGEYISESKELNNIVDNIENEETKNIAVSNISENNTTNKSNSANKKEESENIVISNGSDNLKKPNETEKNTLQNKPITDNVNSENNTNDIEENKTEIGNVQGAFDEVAEELKTMEIEAFNSGFEAYKGNMSGSNVRSLIQRTKTHNITYKDEKDKLVTIEYNGIDYLEKLDELRNLVEASKEYVVDFKYNSSTGLIEKVIIK